VKLLHVSDWHLGASLYNCSRAPDHEAVLQEMLDIARESRPDLILHTGDLFDLARPAYEDMRRAFWALQEFSAFAPVVVLCGNHDSPVLFQVFNQIMATRDGAGCEIRFLPRACAPSRGGILEFPGGEGELLRLAPVPFIHAGRHLVDFEDPTTWTRVYADRVHAVEAAFRRGLEDGYDPSRHILLFAAHLFVSGALFSRSERPLHISQTYASSAENVPPVTYAAFGHIHRPQLIPASSPARYAGSPLQLDFGEIEEEKSVVLVEARPAHAAHVEILPLSQGRRLRRLEGSLEELGAQAGEVSHELCVVTVDTETATPDLAARVAALFPDAVLLQTVERCQERRLDPLSEADITSAEAEENLADLFRAYLAETGTSQANAQETAEKFAALLGAANADSPVSFPELAPFEETARAAAKGVI